MQKTIGTSEGVILSPNQRRRYLLLVNESTDIIRISFTNYPASTGVPLTTGYGSWELSSDFFNTLRITNPDSEFFGRVNAIAVVAGNLQVVEG